MLVEVAAAGVNFIDVYQREGVYPIAAAVRGGNEGAGTVAAVGPGVDGLPAGDRVAWAQGLGSAARCRRAAGIRRSCPCPTGSTSRRPRR